MTRPSSESQNLCSSLKNKEVILSILKGTLENPNKPNKTLTGNIILDSFSDKSYIRSGAAKTLGLKTQGAECVSLSTLDNKGDKTFEKTKVLLKSTQKNILIEVFITDSIISLSTTNWEKGKKFFPNITFKGLQNQGIVNVDLLIGMDFLNLIRGTEIIRVGELEARSSLLGYYLEGRYESEHNEESSINLASKHDKVIHLENLNYNEPSCIFMNDDRMEARIQEFFTHGDFTAEEDKDSTKDELLQKLNEGTKRVKTETGEILYEVPMLWRNGQNSKNRLQPNFKQVLAFLNSNTKRLRKENMTKTYDQLIQEGIKSGIYEVVPTDPRKGHHIPTFGAINPNSSSTPLRLVLAANLPIGNSVNSELETGPSLIRDLPTLLRQFRCGKTAITGDISKAFHRLVVRKEDRDYFRFLWWAPGKIGQEVLTLRLARVPFGTNLAPFQFFGTLHYHLTSHPEKEIANEILKTFYSDNMVTSIDNTNPIGYVKDSVRILGDGGFQLRKFSSNSEELNLDLKAEKLWNEKEPRETRILGMIWHMSPDTIHFSKPQNKDIKGPITKRFTLKRLMSHFDPLGLLTPLIMPLTALFSKICDSKYEWDQEMSKEHVDEWNNLYKELEKASKISIPRHHALDSSKPVRLMIFTDATGIGWGGACAYLVQDSKSFIVACKAKLPAKRLREKEISVPKRELEALVIGGKLLVKLKATYKDRYYLEPHLFCDSQIVLNWMSNKTKVNTFVDNRVRLITQLIEKTPLHYIPTDQNPADFVSRGLTSKEFLEKSHLFWTGSKKCMEF